MPSSDKRTLDHTATNFAVATRDDLLNSRALILELSHNYQMTKLRVDVDGTLVVTAVRPGYTSIIEFAEVVSSALGLSVRVVSSDAPRPRPTALDF